MLLSRLLTAALVPLLLLGCPGGTKDKKDKVEEEVEVILPPPSAKLIVGGLDPSFGDPNREFRAEVFGSGFEKGANVVFSGNPARNTQVTDDAAIAVTVPGLPPGVYDVTVINPDGEKATMRKGLMIRDVAVDTCQTITVYFDFDSSGLSAPVREQLDVLAACVRASGQSVVVEGHCDERGTTEYNLSLGQRRADAVVRYLGGLGVNPAGLRPVSWGEERPAVDGHDTDAWAANRRAQLVVQE